MPEPMALGDAENVLAARTGSNGSSTDGRDLAQGLGMNVLVRGTARSKEVADMVPLLLVLLLVLILFGVGFVLKVLWWVALAVLVLWLLGFVFRSIGPGGARGRWYRW